MRKQHFSYMFISLTIFAFTLVIIVFPKETAEAVTKSLKLCLFSVIPSLFPFMVITKTITNLHLTDYLTRYLNKFMMPFFSVNGTLATALILGMCGGYPLGAITCASVYNSGECSKNEAERALAFCNNCGPAFILGIVGYGIFSSSELGLILLCSHIAGSLCVGIVFKIASPLAPENYIQRPPSGESVNLSKGFTSAVTSSLNSIMTICAYIIVFAVIIRIAELSHILHIVIFVTSSILHINYDILKAFFSGILEMTTGAFSLAQIESLRIKLILASFFLGWGGFSVHFQTLAMLEDTNLNTKQHFIGKALHGVFSSIITYLLTFII